MSALDDAYQLGLLNGLRLGRKAERERLARDSERCPICDATQPEGHVLGCPVPDVPR